MSSPVQPTSSSDSVAPSVPQTPGVTGSSSSFNASTNIKSLQDLPQDLLNAMMMGIAQTVVKSMQDHQDHLKKIMDDARRDTGT